MSLSRKEEIIEKAVGYITCNNIKGAYFEFGCYKGHTTIAANHFSKKMNKDLNFYIFDSFEGLPQPTKEDGHLPLLFKGAFSCSKDAFIKRVVNYGVNPKKLKIFKGWYSDILNDETAKKIKEKASIVLIDCDLYSSTKLVLNFIKPFIQSGTLLIFDDWFLYTELGGERKAFYEWLEENPNIRSIEFHKSGDIGHSFIINLRVNKEVSRNSPHK